MHHAYLLIGSHEAGELYVDKALEKLGVDRLANPDLYVFKQESFSIEDARTLSEKSLEKAFGKKKVFIISFERITVQAQNAVLKTLEEPTADTHFFIIAREEKLFLPTLLSRVQIVHIDREKGAEQGEKFLKLNIAKRMDFAKSFEGSLPSLLDSILNYLKDSGAKSSSLDDVFSLRKFASDPAVNARLMLEHLALVL